jgi:hypothetical protein
MPRNSGTITRRKHSISWESTRREGEDDVWAGGESWRGALRPLGAGPTATQAENVAPASKSAAPARRRPGRFAFGEITVG